MPWTKRQYVEAAYTEIGLADYVFNLQPQELESSLRRLDTMMADWYERGILLGYPLPMTPGESDLDTPTAVPDRANEAIVTNLAIKIAPSYGKQVSQGTLVAAREALNTLLVRAARPGTMQYPTQTPAGAGNKYWGMFWGPFLRPPEDQATEAGNDLDFEE